MLSDTSTAVDNKSEGSSHGATAERAQKCQVVGDGAAARAQEKAAVVDSEQRASQTSEAGRTEVMTQDAEDAQEPACKKLAPSRCISCKKKVGLLGFHCRCGGTFCEKHRYSDKHECSFDYRSHGRDQVCLWAAHYSLLSPRCSLFPSFSLSRATRLRYQISVILATLLRTYAANLLSVQDW